ncbi:1-phosphofructokinase family hexose kinase [Curtobacterium pusillum]|uniref:1-phosphofructokinase family hexose kinase n=1 Tax=Curtobacterium pusillum TaxID=69373 RepID=UPI00119D1673|nr:PfkB family carbohydrate kinase [Curtobacterium pusillum]
MIIVVTPNPAVDVTYRVAEQRIGATQRVLDVARRPGGKGLNVGRVLAATGTGTHAVLPLGGPSGRWVADALDALRLPHSDVAVTGETRTTVTVVDDREHPTMFGEPGPRVTPDEWDAVTASVERLLDNAEPSALVVSGSLPSDTDPAVVGAWVAAARARGVPGLVDCSGDALLAAADAGATICKPNRGELLEATGAADERAGALQLLDRGAAVVVVSRGADGIAAHTVDDVVEVPAIAGVTGNPTGAGDAATAGLITALAARPAGVSGAGAPVVVDETALRTAAAFGAAAVLRPVAGEVDPDDVRRFLTTTETDTDTDTAPHDRTGSPA